MNSLFGLFIVFYLRRTLIFINIKIKIYHNLDFTNSDIWTRKTKVKIEVGRRIVSLDEDTISVLKE